jgi:hypothetical protein
VFGASLVLITAVPKQKHEQMTFFLICMAVGLVVPFVQVYITLWIGLGVAFLMAGLNGYFLICVYSLTNKLKDSIVKDMEIKSKA